jgi:NADH-quinone oxidoreductase subunit E
MKEGTTVSREQERNILIALKDVQDRSGYISGTDIEDIARSFNTSAGDVYGVATFYSFLRVSPAGRHVVKICQSLPCHLKEGEAVIKRLSEVLGISPGETTPDGRFTLELANCIGACDTAPAMLIDDQVRGNLTTENIAGILESYR